MSWKKVKLAKVLTQYRQEVLVQDEVTYIQVTISKHDGVKYRGQKIGKEIGRKRQFIINLKAHPNTLLLVRQGVYDGGIGLAPKEVDGCIATENMPMFSVGENVNPDFLSLIIQSELFRNEISKISLTGSAQKSIHERQVLEIEIPLPTIEEQSEIITAWEKVRYDILALNDETINQLSFLKKLRQSLLQDAVQGRLVAQDAADEPAAVLLQKIKAEKEALIAVKKLKKEKPLPPIREEDIPFDVPQGWEWCRLNAITEISSGIALGKRYSGVLKTYPYLRVANVQRGFINTGIIKFLSLPEVEAAKYFLEANDLLINEGGDFDKVGRCALWDGRINDCIHQNHIFRVRPIVNNPKWLDVAINSDESRQYFLGAYKKSTNLASINKTRLSELPIPLPPFAEQNRIIQKLESLVAACDALEVSIKTSQQQATQLLQIILREALQKNPQATAKSRQQTPTVIPLHIPENKRPFARQVLAGKIIELFRDDSQFTHIKFQKLQYLAEHLAQAEVGQSYYMQRAGPHDNAFMHSIAQKLQRSKWYDERNYRFHPMAKATEIDGYYSGFFAPAQEPLAKLFSLLKTASENQCEMVATLYAVWNDRIIRKEPITDELLFEDFYKWSDRKLQYTQESLEKCLNWMQRNDIIPVGFGEVTKVARSKR